jgi:hypothetical protein
MKIFERGADNLSSTVKAVERDGASRPKIAVSPVPFGLHLASSGFIAEWQQRGPETVSGHALRKLRLTLAPPPPVTTAIPAC